jgi:hypothetical protein
MLQTMRRHHPARKANIALSAAPDSRHIDPMTLPPKSRPAPSAAPGAKTRRGPLSEHLDAAEALGLPWESDDEGEGGATVSGFGETPVSPGFGETPQAAFEIGRAHV